MVDYLKNFPENGTVLIFNFKKGELSEYLYSMMSLGEVNKGSFIVTGPYTNNVWQKAHDFCNNVKNYLGKSSSYYKEDYTDVYSKINKKVDLLIIDHSSIENAIDAVKSAEKLLNIPATIVVKLPVLYHNQFQINFNTLFPKLKVKSEGNYSYITYRFDKVIHPPEVVRDRNTQMT